MTSRRRFDVIMTLLLRRVAAEVRTWKRFPHYWPFVRTVTSHQVTRPSCRTSVMLGRFTLNSRGIWDWVNAKLAVTRELMSKVLCSSYVTHQKVTSYSWILAITRAYSPLKSTRSTTTFNRQKRPGTCQLHLRVTQLAVASSFCSKYLQVGRNSLDGLVCH